MLLLFDIDGTLLLTGGAGSRAINRAMAELYGVEQAMETIKPGGKTDPAIIAEAFRVNLHREPTESEVRAVQDLYGEYIDAEVNTASDFRLMPCVAETIAELRQDASFTLGIATGNSAVGARAKLRRAGLEHAFAVGGYGSDSSHRPTLVQIAIDRANEHRGRPFAGTNVVVIGDTPYDIEAARACGVRVVAVATGSFGEHDLRSADVVLPTLAGLVTYLGSATTA